MMFVGLLSVLVTPVKSDEDFKAVGYDCYSPTIIMMYDVDSHCHSPEIIGENQKVKIQCIVWRIGAKIFWIMLKTCCKTPVQKHKFTPEILLELMGDLRSDMEAALYNFSRNRYFHLLIAPIEGFIILFE